MGVKVKPLVWADGKYASYELSAGFAAYYTIDAQEYDLEEVSYGIHCHEFGTSVIWRGPKGGGMAAAQADYERCILSALIEDDGFITVIPPLEPREVTE